MFSCALRFSEFAPVVDDPEAMDGPARVVMFGPRSCPGLSGEDERNRGRRDMALGTDGGWRESWRDLGRRQTRCGRSQPMETASAAGQTTRRSRDRRVGVTQSMPGSQPARLLIIVLCY